MSRTIAEILSFDDSIPTLVEESSQGTQYNIVAYKGMLYAIHQDDGAFQFGKITSCTYNRPVYTGSDLPEIRAKVLGSDLNDEREIAILREAVKELSEKSKALEDFAGHQCRFSLQVITTPQ